MPEEKKAIDYQKVADNFGIRYFINFRVLGVRDVEFMRYIAVAEVYEKKSWRNVILTGRMYTKVSTAQGIKDDAEQKQKFLLESLHLSCPRTNDFGFDVKDFPNPIDHMEPVHEL